MPQKQAIFWGDIIQPQVFKILIVDDSLENRAVFRDMLTPLGFETCEAENGQEGIKKAEIFQPDVIITDLFMPVIDGFEMISRIRRHPVLKTTPVIATSASVNEKDHPKNLEDKVDRFLPKPVKVDQLYEMLQKILNMEWIYEESQDKTGEQIKSAEFILPETESLEIILDIAEKGDVTKLREYFEYLKSSDERLKGVSEKLNQLLKDHKINEITDLTKGWLNQKR